MIGTAGVTAPSGARVEVTWSRRDLDGRNRYAWMVADTTGATVATGDDLGSGVGDPVDAMRAVESLGAFLGAYAEALDYGPDSDNYTLFPSILDGELARELSDEIAMTLTDENGDYLAPEDWI